MKQILRSRGGLCPIPNPIIYPLYKLFITLTVVLVSCVCSRAQVPASSPEAGPAAGAVEGIKPLKIGDTIPDVLWNLPLEIVKAGQEGSTTVTLNDYKGKLIILDFWATNCSSCVRAMPKLNARQKEFKDKMIILPVSYERKERIATSFSKNPKLRKSSLGTVVEDKELKRYFSHEYISHVIWIDADGIVKAITKTDYVSAENIKSVLNKESIDWPVKRDVTDFKYDQPLVKLNRANLPTFSIPGFQYHSAFTGNLANINRLYRAYPDTVNNFYRVYMVNHTIPDLYFRNGMLDIPISQVYLDTDLPGRFFFDEDTVAYREAWDIGNTFCYEATFPLRFSEKQRQKKITSDLDFYLGLQSGFEDLEIKCLLVRDADNIEVAQVTEGEKSAPKLKEIVYFLNHSLLSCPVIDETADGEEIRIGIDRDKVTDLSLLRKKLAEAGFSMTEEKRTIRMFVLRDNNNQ